MNFPIHGFFSQKKELDNDEENLIKSKIQNLEEK